MTKLTENLQAIVDAWSAKLKLPVQLNLLVGSGKRPLWGAWIGEMGTDFSWHSASNDLATAQAEVERQWRADGAPTKKADAEKAKLKARAEELGLRVTEWSQSYE